MTLKHIQIFIILELIGIIQLIIYYKLLKAKNDYTYRTLHKIKLPGIIFILLGFYVIFDGLSQ